MLTIEEVVAKQAISDVMYRYCRSVDRMDRALYDTVFEAGAPVNIESTFVGTAEEFAEWVWAQHVHHLQLHQHQIFNLLIEVDTDAGTAVSETYVTVCGRQWPDQDGKVVDALVRARYMDQWRIQADGNWRISDRLEVMDIIRFSDATTSPPITGVRDTTDPSYALFG